MPEEVKKSLIGDLAGLSEPLKKLVEVVSSGVGRFTDAMWFAKRDADNEAYKILKVGGAQTQVVVDRMKAVGAIGSGSTPQIQKLTLAGNEVNAELSDGQQAVIALKERSDNRAEYQNLLHQLNTEQVVSYAAEELAHEGTTVSEEPIDENWKARYFNIVQDVSGDELQALWGRVLAGEIKKTSSYSLRTLEILRNITQVEAKLFERACKYLIVSRASSISAVYKGKENEIGLDAELKYSEIALLIEAGLIHSNSDANIVSSMEMGAYAGGYKIGSKMVAITGSPSLAKKISIPVYTLTIAGKEISTLLSDEVPSIKFLKSYFKSHTDLGMIIKWANFDDWKEGKIVYSGELTELPESVE